MKTGVPLFGVDWTQLEHTLYPNMNWILSGRWPLIDGILIPNHRPIRICGVNDFEYDVYVFRYLNISCLMVLSKFHSSRRDIPYLGSIWLLTGFQESIVTTGNVSFCIS
jgi:hypothetical protein